MTRSRAKRNDFAFGIGIDVNNATGEILAVYFQVRKGKAAEVIEMAGGAAFVNFDKSGQLLGVELLAPCSMQIFDKIAQQVPLAERSSVRKFLRSSVPREMIAA